VSGKQGVKARESAAAWCPAGRGRQETLALGGRSSTGGVGEGGEDRARGGRLPGSWRRKRTDELITPVNRSDLDLVEMSLSQEGDRTVRDSKPNG